MAFKLEASAATDKGQKRSNNEDSFLIDDRVGVYVVADGIGGHRGGEIASELATRIVRDQIGAGLHVLSNLAKTGSVADRTAATALVERAIQTACAEIHRQNTAGGGGRMGTTLDVVVRAGPRIVVGHVGDSRVYLVRQGAVHRLTEDHTLAALQVKAGVMTREEEAESKLRSILTRNVGSHESVQVDTLHVDLAHGDVLLLCSDGLHMYLGDEEIAARVATTTPEAAARGFVAHANARGGADNVTALVIRATSGPKDLESTVAFQRLDALRATPLLQHLTYKEQVAALAIAQPATWAAGEIIVAENTPGAEMYVIVSGRVSVEHQAVRIAELGAGGHFGEMSLVDYAPRSATVRAMTPTQALVFTQAAVGGLMRADPVVGVKILWSLVQELSSRLRTSNAELIDWRKGEQGRTVRLPFADR